MQARGLPDTYGRLVNRWWLLLPMSLLFMAGLMDWRPAGLAAHARPAGAARRSGSRCASSTTARSSGRRRWSTRRCSTWRRGCPGSASARAPRRSPVGPTHMLLLVAAMFGLIGFRLGLNNQNSNILDVGYASVVGADRLIDRRAPVGVDAGHHGQAVRRLPRRRRPDRLRPAHRGAASRRSRPAAPTARRSTWPTSRSWPPSAGAGCGTTCRRARRGLRRSTSRPCSACSAAGLAAGVAAAGGADGVRLGGQPVHAVRAQPEHERRAGRRAAGLDDGAARAPGGARGDARAAPRCRSSRRSAWCR